MGRINLGRVIIGGLVAGVIVNIFEYVLNGLMLAGQWHDVMTSLGRPDFDTTQIVEFNVLGFIIGLAAVWTYAAIRPRFGAGPMTAVYAAVITWVTAYGIVDVMMMAMGINPLAMTLMLLGVGLIEIVIATLVGAFLYKEE